MVSSSSKKNSPPICFQCGSELIFISQETVQPEGMRYPQINTVYRCSNEACQERKDKDRADREEQRLIRAATDKDKKEKIQEKRRQGRKVKLAEN